MQKSNISLIKTILELITEVVENIIDPMLFTKKEIKQLQRAKRRREVANARQT